MADEELNMIFDNLDEYVYDQGRIVTAKWLSISLNVPLNTSQRAVETFVEKQTKEGKPLDVTYFVSGIFHEDGNTCWKCKVVKESNLKDFKSSCENIICENIYSIQQSPLKNSGMIYSSTYDATIESLSSGTINKWNNIICDAKKRLKTANAVIMKTEVSSAKQKSGTAETAPTINSEPISKPKKTADVPPAKKVQPSSFFGAAKKSKPKSASPNAGKSVKDVQSKSLESEKVTKEEEEQAEKKALREEEIEKKKNVKEKKNPKKESPIEAKETSRKKKYKPVVAVQEKNDGDDGNADFGDSDDSGDGFESFVAAAKKSGKSNLTQNDEDSKPPPVDSKKATSSKPTTKKRKVKDKEETPKAQGSESAVDSTSQSLTPTPTSEIQPTQDERQSTKRAREAVNDVKQRKRRRVLKSKTYMNDDGYMVTEKVYESESFSEDSDIETGRDTQMKKTQIVTSTTQQTANAPTVVPKAQTHSGVVKKKAQSSLTSFFKKK